MDGFHALFPIINNQPFNGLKSGPTTIVLGSKGTPRDDATTYGTHSFHAG